MLTGPASYSDSHFDLLSSTSRVAGSRANLLLTTSKVGCSSQIIARPTVSTGFESGEHNLVTRTWTPKELKCRGKWTTSCQPSWQGPLPRNPAQFSKVAHEGFSNMIAYPSALNWGAFAVLFCVYSRLDRGKGAVWLGGRSNGHYQSL